MVTVGVIAARGYGQRTRSYLADLVTALQMQDLEPRIQSGHLTRCRRDDSPLGRGRVIVVGDAAGLLEPWTREGISFALRSGVMAGEAAAKAASTESSAEASLELSAYEQGVTDKLAPEMRAGAELLYTFSRYPSIFHAGLAMPKGWDGFSRFCRGDTNFARVMRHRWVRRSLSLINSLPHRRQPHI
jgi:flavin-dependent dehydrogenase